MQKMSLTRRIKDYCIEVTRCIYDSDKKTIKCGVNDEKLLTNLARAKREIIDIIKLNLTPASCLLTLTYRENMQDYNRAYKDFKYFVDRIKYNFKIDLRYLRVIELQERGAIHFHVVIFNDEFIKIKYNDIYNLWGNGAVHIRKIENLDSTTFDKIGNYLGKYLSKSKNIAWNKRIYTTSRNLKRIHKERIIIEDEQLFTYYDDLLTKNSNIVISNDNIRYKKYIKRKNI